MKVIEAQEGKDWDVPEDGIFYLRCPICHERWLIDDEESGSELHECEHIRFRWDSASSIEFFGIWNPSNFEKKFLKELDKSEEIYERLLVQDDVNHGLNNVIVRSSVIEEILKKISIPDVLEVLKKSYLQEYCMGGSGEAAIFWGINPKRVEIAKSSISKKTKSNQTGAITWFNKGNALCDKGNYDKAFEAFEKAIKLDPKYADAWNELAQVLYHEGRCNGAIAAYDEVIGINPQNASVWNNKAKALKSLGKYDESIRAYDRAIEIDPQDIRSWNDKGITLKNMGKYDDAIKSYEKAIEIDPNYVHPWYNKGNALRKLHKYDKAIEAYDKAIGLNPNDADAWHNKGEALKSLGRNKEADSAFAKAKELAKDHK